MGQVYKAAFMGGVQTSVTAPLGDGATLFVLRTGASNSVRLRSLEIGAAWGEHQMQVRVIRGATLAEVATAGGVQIDAVNVQPWGRAPTATCVSLVATQDGTATNGGVCVLSVDTPRTDRFVWEAKDPADAIWCNAGSNLRIMVHASDTAHVMNATMTFEEISRKS